MERMRSYVRKNKNAIIVGSIVIALFALILIAAITGSINNMRTTDSELLRAMNYEEFKEGHKNTQSQYVKFGAFFLRDINFDGYAESIKGTCKEVGKEDTLYMEINVTGNGYFKDGKITINGNNFYLQTRIPKDDSLKSNVVGNNIKAINFDTINNGFQKTLMGVVRSGDYSSESTKAAAIGNDTKQYSRDDNSVVLTGTYVAPDGTETQVNKEIKLTVDWYGEAKAEIASTTQVRDNKLLKADDNSVVYLPFDVIVTEPKNELLVKNVNASVRIPDFNGYAPIKIEVGGVTVASAGDDGFESLIYNVQSGNNVYRYDSNAKILTMKREAVVDDDGIVQSKLSNTNTFSVKVTYPSEAYVIDNQDTVQIKVPATGSYELFNNTNDEFSNPYKTNIAQDIIMLMFEQKNGPAESDGPETSITIGNYAYEPATRRMISKLKPLNIYNGVSDSEQNDTYPVMWHVYAATDQLNTNIIMKERKNGDEILSDTIVKADGSELSMHNFVSNKGIYFIGASNILKNDGYIKVYNDETDELLVTFDSSNWGAYNSEKPYIYDTPVRHIRVETSEIEQKGNIYVYSIKEIDDVYITSNFDRDEFNNFKVIRSTLNAYANDTFLEKTRIALANYEDPFSVANFKISRDEFSTQGTDENVTFTINAIGNEYSNEIKWINGSFIIALPEQILDVDINNIRTDKSNVKISNYEVADENGTKLIKIITSNDSEETFNIYVDAKIIIDPRVNTQTTTAEMYASNENVKSTGYYYPGEDKYDVNNNNNKNEYVNKRTLNISLIAPNYLITNEYITEYNPDIEGESTLTNALIPKNSDSARINISLNNNYNGDSISEVVVLGRVPYSGNKTAISEIGLNSEFDTFMTDEGIIVPDELKDKVTIYYSENGDATRNLYDASNAWTTTPTDFSKVKSYMIDFGDNKIAKGEKYDIYYNVNIPDTVRYNQTSYTQHGVYFCLDTEEGKYKTTNEANKVGLTIAKQYNIEVTKYQKGRDNTVSGATYVITEDGQSNGTTKVTDENGKLVVKDLYVDKVYKIKELLTPEDYELNNNEVKVKIFEDENGNLVAQKLSGDIRGEITISKLEGERDYTIHVNVEDEVRAKFQITKVEQGSNIPIKNAKFRLTGKGLPNSGAILTSNANGIVDISGLYLNERYTLTETSVDGHYLAGTIVFVARNNSGTYSFEKVSGNVANSEVAFDGVIPKICVTIEDEKIPTYTLELTKIEKNKPEVLLEGAKFALYYNDKEIGTYTTNDQGKIVIDDVDLYQYEASKNIEHNYTLKEILAPEGYSKVKDINFKVVKEAGVIKFVETVQDGQSAKEWTVDGTTVKITVEDNPTLKLTKIDGTTKEILPNVKFAIFNIDDGEQPAKDSKGNIIGTKEVINGVEYYVITTDANGEIPVTLPEGLYKVVELSAPEKYNIEDCTYYIGIGASREGESIYVPQDSKDVLGEGSNVTISNVIQTLDGGYVVTGYTTSPTLQIGNDTIQYTLTQSYNGKYKDPSGGFIIKYDKNKNIEWYDTVNGTRDQNFFKEVIQLKDGTIVAMRKELYVSDGYSHIKTLVMYKNGINIKEITPKSGNSQRIVATPDGGFVEATRGYQSIIITKYNASGNVVRSKSITSTRDIWLGGLDIYSDNGDIMVFESGNVGTTLKYDGINYTSKGEGIFTLDSNMNFKRFITKDYNTINDDSLIALNNGELISAKPNTSSITVTKFDASGNTIWQKNVLNAKTGYHLTKTSDGNIILAGSAKTGNYDGISVPYDSGSMLVKMNVEDGTVMYAMGFNGGNNNAFGFENEDGEFSIVTTYTSTDNYSINEFVGNNVSGDITITEFEKQYIDTLVVKDTNIIYTKAKYNTVISTSDGGYIAVFKKYTKTSGNINVENVTYSNDVVIKYNRNGSIEWVKCLDTDLVKAIPTSDGGYIVIAEKERIIKLDSNGDIEWDTYITNAEYKDIIETSNKQFVIVGKANARIEIGDLIAENNGGYDGIYVALNNDGSIQKLNSIGGNQDDEISTVAEDKNGNFYLGGYYSEVMKVNGKDLEFGGRKDAIVLELDEYFNVIDTLNFGGYWHEYITCITPTSDGGHIIGVNFYSNEIEINGITLKKITRYTDSAIIKFDSNNVIEWYDVLPTSQSLDTSISFKKIIEDKNGGYYVLLNSANSSMVLDNGDFIGGGYSIIKYTRDGKVEYGKSLKNITTEMTDLLVTTDGSILVAGFNSYANNAAIFKIAVERAIPETTELTIENQYKEFRITTDVNEITPGVKGGSISGEDENPYETVVHGNDSVKEIKMIPDTGYEIISITVNGEVYTFTPEADGSFTMPQFTNVTENKHVVVTYGLKVRNFTINKVDKNTGEKLEGAKFQIDQIEERTEPDIGVIGDLTANGSADYIDTAEEKTDKVGSKVDNGIAYTVQEADRTKEITGVVDGTIGHQDNYQYYFTKQNDVIVPNNQGKSGDARSYIKIDLTGRTGNVMLVVNAAISSKKDRDYGYAKVTNNTNYVYFNGPSASGYFINTSGIDEAKDYNTKLTAGSVYYLHFGYYKGGNDAGEGEDTFKINSINVYEMQDLEKSFGFEQIGDKYISTNKGYENTTSNAYFPIDLRGMTGKFVVSVNAEISTEYYRGYGYAFISEDTTRQDYNYSTNRFVYMYYTSNPYTYSSSVLEGGKIYYLHVGYYKNGTSSSGDDVFTINSIKVYEKKSYNFIEENGKYVNNNINTSMSNTRACSYIPIDLTNYKGKYIVSANVETENMGTSDYVYVGTTGYISTGSSYSNIASINKDRDNREYSTVLEGGRKYYLTMTYVASKANNEGKAYVSNIRIALSDADLYHGEVETDGEGKAVTQLPYGKYKITEIKAPDGYVIEDGLPDFEFRENGTTNEITIENEKAVKLNVHHYIKGTTTKVADDEVVEGKVGENYTTYPKLDLEEYELEVDDNGEYILPDNATGTFTQNPEDVIYYYVKKKATLVVHHYIVDTVTPVPLSDGNLAQDVHQTGEIDEDYTTEAISPADLSDKYELVAMPDNWKGKLVAGETEVTYFYRTKLAEIIVHHVDKETNEPIANDVTISDKRYGDSYTTEVLNPIPANYEYDSRTSNFEGIVELPVTEVTYYYTYKEPTPVVDVEKESVTEKLNTRDDTITYTIDYTATIKDYKGNARLTIVDELPYEIDLSASDIKDGSYNATDNTITWEDRFANINTFENGDYTITFTRQITVLYKDVDARADNIKNVVKGKVTIFDNKGEEVTVEDEDDVDTPIDIQGTIIVRYVYLRTGAEIADRVTHTGKIGTLVDLSNDKKEFDEYILITEPTPVEFEEYEQTLTYIYSDEAKYTIEYYKSTGKDANNEYIFKQDTSLTEQHDAIINSIITRSDITIKNIDGYSYLRDDIGTGLKISKNPENNVIKIYFVKNDYAYSVEYYFDEVIDDNLTENKVAEFGDIIRTYTDKIKPGYKLVRTEYLPLTISSNPANNVIKIYYAKQNYDYIVEYYYNNVKDESLTDEFSALYGEVIKDYTDKRKTGFKLDHTTPTMGDDGEGLTISERVQDNIIKVYYVTSAYKYRVEYYYDGVIDDTKTDANLEALYGAEISDYTDKVKTGYSFEKVEVPSSNNNQLPLVIDEDETKNVIKVYYVRNNYKYTVNYFYDGIQDTTKTEEHEALFESEISTYTDKNKTGYKLEKVIVPSSTDNKLPLVIGTNPDENVINVYYVKDNFKYRVEYYYDGVRDDSKTESNIEATYLDEISSYTDKNITGYVLEKVVVPSSTDGKLPLTIGVDEENNVIKVYYVKKDTNVIVRYVDKDTLEDIATSYSIDGKYGDPYTTIKKEDIPNYYFVDDTGNTSGNMEEDTITVIYYYRKYKHLVVEFREKSTNIELDDKVLHTGKAGEAYDITPDKHDIDGYTLVEEPTLTGTYVKDLETLIFYYAKNSKVITEYIYKRTGEKIETDVVKEGYEGAPYDITDTNKDIDGYVLIEEPDDSVKTGLFTREDQIFTYYYAKKGQVIVKYIDKVRNEEISDRVTKNGYEGLPFDVGEDKKDIDGYVLIEEPVVKTGTMTTDTQEFIYYYAVKSNVIVKYVDEEGNELSDRVIKPGFEGEDFNISGDKKDIDGYVLIREPEIKTGTYTREDQTFVFVYAKKAKVIAKYLDIETGKVISEKPQYELDGYVGKEYATEQKEFIDYIFVKSTNNTSGTMTEDTINVIYYYQKEKPIPQEPTTETKRHIKPTKLNRSRGISNTTGRLPQTGESPMIVIATLFAGLYMVVSFIKYKLVDIKIKRISKK